MSSRSSAPSDGDRGIPAVILVVGSEATLRDAELAKIRERVLAGGPSEFNEDRLDLASPGSDVKRILGALYTLPVLAPARLVRVRGLSDRRAARFVESALPEYLDDPVPTTCLVLEAERVDRRLRWVKRVAEIGEVRDCSAPSRPAELRAWVEARLRERGKRPAHGSAATLLELVGRDLDRLGSEVEKLALFVGDRPEVTPDDVAEATGELRPRALYELTDAIGSRQIGPGLKMLGRLLAQGEAPLAILGALASHFRRLLRARECRPLEAREVQSKLSVHPFAARKLVEQARGFDQDRLLRCLDAIRRTDEALKGGVSLAPDLAVEQLLLAVCA